MSVNIRVDESLIEALEIIKKEIREYFLKEHKIRVEDINGNIVSKIAAQRIKKNPFIIKANIIKKQGCAEIDIR